MKKLLSLILILMLFVCSSAAGEGSDALYETLKSAPVITGECEQLFAVRPQHFSIVTAQGGCTDGVYHYQGFIAKDKASNEENNLCRIVKTDVATGKAVLISEIFNFRHCNDITYNPNTNQLVVAFAGPAYNKIAIVDAETLSLVEIKEISTEIYCIDYNASRDKYVVGIANTRNFRLLNSDFTPADDRIFAPHPATVECIRQGVGCDENMICFVFYRPNLIAVFDWDGNIVTLIELEQDALEPENISIVDGEIYVTYLTKQSSSVYKVTPKLP